MDGWQGSRSLWAMVTRPGNPGENHRAFPWPRLTVNDADFRDLEGPEAKAFRLLLEELLGGEGDGFINALPMEAYLGMPAVSSSKLGRLAIAPAKLKSEMDRGPKPSTDAQVWGHAIHAAILEPDSFEVDYVAAERCTGVLKSGARKGEQCKNDGVKLTPQGWLCGQHGHGQEADTGKVVLSPAALRCCLGLRDNCLSETAQYAQPQARALLTVPGSEVELTGAWMDPETGQPGKLRGDHVADLTATCTDIKSTVTEASTDVFSKSIWNFGYYRQQGWYSGGFEELARPMEDHVILACEKEPPYLVACFRLLDEVVEAGRDEAQRLLRVYAQCMETGVWPGYAPHIIDIGLPPWAQRSLAAAETLERTMLT